MNREMKMADENGRGRTSYRNRGDHVGRYRSNGSNGHKGNGHGSNGGAQALMRDNYKILEKEFMRQTEYGMRKMAHKMGILGVAVHPWAGGRFLKGGFIDAVRYNLDCAMEYNGSARANQRILEERLDEFVKKNALTRLVDKKSAKFDKVIRPRLYDIFEVAVGGLNELLTAEGDGTYPGLALDAWPKIEQAIVPLSAGIIKTEQLVDFVLEEHKDMIVHYGPFKPTLTLHLVPTALETAKEVIIERTAQIYKESPEEIYRMIKKKMPA